MDPDSTLGDTAFFDFLLSGDGIQLKASKGGSTPSDNVFIGNKSLKAYCSGTEAVSPAGCDVEGEKANVPVEKIESGTKIKPKNENANNDKKTAQSTDIKVQVKKVKGKGKTETKHTREYFNAASRKTRQKRKLERERLIQRNSDLETEQRRFRATIANLENEIQSLKNSECSFGKIDLETENLLLQAEVKRHKLFIDHVRSIACGAVPKYDYSRQERIRLANNGIESAIGQLLGMCYTSVVDSNWTPPIRFDPNVKQLEDVTVICRHQMLPIGCTAETAARINIRQDFYNVPMKAGELLTAVALGLDLKKEREIGELYEDVKDPDTNTLVELKELDFDFGEMSIGARTPSGLNLNNGSASTDEKLVAPLKVFCSTRRKIDPKKKNLRTAECITLRAQVEKMVNCYGFPSLQESLKVMDKGNNADSCSYENKYRSEKTPAKLIVRTRAPQLAPYQQSSNIERFEDPLLEGFIIREQEDGKGLTITVMSSEPIYESCTRKLPSFKDSLVGYTEEELPNVVRIELAMSKWKMEKMQEWENNSKDSKVELSL